MAYAFFFTLFLERTDLSTILQIKNLNNPSKCEYPSHVVRTYEDVARILGDTVATIETHYSELGFTPSFRKAWETFHARSKMQTTDGTAQPEWLDRFRKVRTPDHHKVGVQRFAGTDSRLVADVPGFEPGFSA